MKDFTYILMCEKGGKKPFLLTGIILFVPAEAFLAPESSPLFAHMEAERQGVVWPTSTAKGAEELKFPHF